MNLKADGSICKLHHIFKKEGALRAGNFIFGPRKLLELERMHEVSTSVQNLK